MSKPYDSLFSLIITRNPQSILDWLYPGSVFVCFHDTKLAHTQRLPDKIMEAKWTQTGSHFLAQPDCQTRPDPLIAQRQLLYHIEILWQPWQTKLKLGIWSKTLNLTREATNFSFPLRLTVPGPDGREVPAIDFYCESKKVSDWTPEELIAYGHPELLVFLPATNGGATRENVERMISLLEGDYELLLGGFLIAELVFTENKQYADLEWLNERRTIMIADPLVTHSQLYRDILAQGEAKGAAQAAAQIQAAKEAEEEANLRAAQAETRAEAEARARAEAEAAAAETRAQLEAETRAKVEAEAAVKIQQAKAEAEAAVKIQQTIGQVLAQARQSVLQIMLKRFLALAELANNLVAKITNPTLLQDLLGKLALADSAEEAEQCLRSVQAAIA